MVRKIKTNFAKEIIKAVLSFNFENKYYYTYRPDKPVEIYNKEDLCEFELRRQRNNLLCQILVEFE